MKMIFYRLMTKYFRYSFLKCRALFHILLSGIIIFIVPFSIQAQEKEPPTSCRDLTSPNNQTEVNELLSCIRALNRERNSQRDLLKIQNKFVSSEQLSGQINSANPTTGNKIVPSQQSGTCPGSVVLSNRIQTNLSQANKNQRNPSSSVITKKRNSGTYPGSIELTQKIQKRIPSSGKNISAVSLLESNPELRGPKSFSESKMLSEKIKSRSN